jgi:hypothetical protein
MSYPASIGALRIVPLGRAIDRMSGYGDVIPQEALLSSPAIFQVGETVSQALNRAGVDQFSPIGAMVGDLVYENAYLASIARWRANGGNAEPLDALFTNNIVSSIRDILDGLWPF